MSHYSIASRNGKWILAGIVTLVCVTFSFAQTSAFTYQGQLNSGGVPAGGEYDFQFRLWDASAGGNAVADTIVAAPVPVTNGVFTVTLDFGGGVFDGSARWLETGVRTNGNTDAHTILAPRQEIASTPYATRAAMAASASSLSGTVASGQIIGSIPAAQIGGGTVSSAITFNHAANLFTGAFSGTFSGTGAELAGVPGTLPWQTVPGTAQIAAANAGYLITNTALTTLTLPAVANPGDVVRVSGVGVGGWQATTVPGLQWTAHEANRNWYPVAVSSDGSRMAAGVIGGQIYVSGDSGQTWMAKEGNRNWFSIAGSADGARLAAVANGGRIYVSADFGQTWAPVENNRAWSGIASSTDGLRLAAVVTGGQIHVSSDGGTTWTARESNRGWFSIASSADGMTLLASVLGGKLYVSTDSGLTWSAKESNRFWYPVAVSADGSRMVAAVTGGKIYLSPDSGASWAATESDRNWFSVASSADGARLVAVVSNGQIYTSVDAGATWGERESHRDWRAVASSADGSRLLAATYGGRLYTSDLPEPIAGLPESTASFQYVGNNQWLPQQEAYLADGAVTDPKIVSLDGAKLTGTVADERLTANIARQADLQALNDTLVARLIATNELLLAQLTVVSNFASTNIPQGVMVASIDAEDPGLIEQGLTGISSVPGASWVNGTTTGQPSARNGQSTIWSGTEMIVWGGSLAAGVYSASGGRYDPAMDQWTTVSTISAPTARSGHTAVWDGSRMIVWGGVSGGGYLATGGRYTPSLQQWISVTTTDAPSARSGQVAVWNGTRMIVWGGQNSFDLLSDGAMYDPATDTWTALSLPNPPEKRRDAVAVWTGTELLLWGGQGESGALNSGARLSFDGSGDPVAWQTMSATGVPSARTGHTIVRAGTRILVWGGIQSGTALGEGAAYDPGTDTWTAISSVDAPSARAAHGAVWKGGEMLIWGGEDAGGSFASGGAYDPESDRWRSLSTTGSPLARSHAGIEWSGTELLVFGGSSSGTPAASLQRLDPKPAWYFYRKP